MENLFKQPKPDFSGKRVKNLNPMLQMVHPSPVRNITDIRESEPTEGIELGQTETFPPESPAA